MLLSRGKAGANMQTEEGRTKWRSSIVLLLTAIFVIALLLRVGLAVRHTNVNHPDEVFQTREAAHRLAYGYGVVTWEYREGVRSWVFPAFLAGVMRATDSIGAGSAGYLLGITVVLSLLSLSTVWFAFMWSYRTSGTIAAVVAAGTCAIWYELVYYAPRALNEVVAAHFFLPGLYLGVYGSSIRERHRLFVAGLFFGLALALRALLTPAVILAAAYICRRNWRDRLAPMIAGIVLPVAAFGLLDAITWSYPFQSYVRYFWVNIVEGRSLIIGLAAPWYTYALILTWQLGPMIPLAAWGARRSPLLGWVALAILLTHSAIPHKEYRYIYPVLPIVIALAAASVAEVASELNAWWRRPRSPGALVGACLIVLAVTSAYFAGRSPSLAPLSRESGNLIAFRELSRDPTVCGVAIRGFHWSLSGGYTYLHRKVPIILVLHDDDFERLAATFNTMVSTLPLPPRHDGFDLVTCWGGTCLYRRAGACRPPTENEINQLLKEKGGNTPRVGIELAGATGFEPAISCVTGRCVKPGYTTLPLWEGQSANSHSRRRVGTLSTRTNATEKRLRNVGYAIYTVALPREPLEAGNHRDRARNPSWAEDAGTADRRRSDLDGYLTLRRRRPAGHRVARVGGRSTRAITEGARNHSRDAGDRQSNRRSTPCGPARGRVA
jgi:phosphatidylinositol glycan class B